MADVSKTSRWFRSPIVYDAGLLRPGKLISYLVPPESIEYVDWPDNISYVTRTGDRLDNLATAFYGDPRLAWLISEFQPYPLESSIFIQPGRTLYIPTPDRVQREILIR